MRGIFDARDDTTVTRQMYFHWDYLNERVKQSRSRAPHGPGRRVRRRHQDGQRAVELSAAIDNEFRNSIAETLTETERHSSSALSRSPRPSSAPSGSSASQDGDHHHPGVVANTMAMTVRERISEYATLKALGFGRASWCP